MEKIAIIGSNESSNQFILRAKELGYETHVFSMIEDDKAKIHADFFYPVSIDNKEEIIRICNTIVPTGVCSICSEDAVQTANYVARALRLVSNNQLSDVLTGNKFEMRKALRKHNLPSPWFIRVTDHFNQEFAYDLTYPLIVKPTDRWSSKGVCCVSKPKELPAAVKGAVSVAFEKKSIIEEFIEGPEYSCECISYAGKHTVLAYTKKYTSGYPYYIETGHVQPSDLSKVQKETITPTIYQALDALKIEYGATHTEFKVSRNGTIGIIEIEAHMGGDCIGTDLVQLSTGYDYIQMTLDVATGKEPSFHRISEAKTAIIKYILTERDLEKFLYIKEKYHQYLWRVSDLEAIGSRTVIDSSTRFGYFILAIDQTDVAAISKLTGMLGK